jgi:hypothetical protein
MRWISPSLLRKPLGLLVAGLLGLGAAGGILIASEGEKPQKHDYSAVFAPPAPYEQGADEAEAKSGGCKSCHAASDEADMHASPAVVLGCTDCHGGNAKVALTD